MYFFFLVCMTLLINDSAPNNESLGSLNGLGQVEWLRSLTSFLAL
jgi:hypothetical protein